MQTQTISAAVESSSRHKHPYLAAICGALIALAVGMGIGLEVGQTLHHRDGDSAATVAPSPDLTRQPVVFSRFGVPRPLRPSSSASQAGAQGGTSTAGVEQTRTSSGR